MEQWLLCPTLSAPERSVIEWAHTSCLVGTRWEVTLQFLVNNHWPQITSAVAKARSAGLLREWRTPHHV